MTRRPLEEERGTFRLEHAIANLRHFETGIDFGGDSLELSQTLQMRDEAAKICVAHRMPAPN
jgi:hypothetical protein